MEGLQERILEELKQGDRTAGELFDACQPVSYQKLLDALFRLRANQKISYYFQGAMIWQITKTNPFTLDFIGRLAA